MIGVTLWEHYHEHTVYLDMKAHYDFDYSKAKPNRFAARLAQERLMVVLDPEIATIFPTSEAVNEALRVLAAAVKNLPSPNPLQQRKRRTSVPESFVQA
jgi:hypothetical protein